MGRYIFWSGVLLVSVVIAYPVTLVLVLIYHSLAGNAPEVVATDIARSEALTWLIMLMSAIFMFLFITIHLIIKRKVIRRNNEAYKLLKKYADGSLTDEEREKFWHYRKIGVLKYSSQGLLRLSDRAVDDFR